MTSLSYDGASRQTNKFCYDKIESIDGDGNKRAKFYNGAPWIMNFELNIMAKTHDDANQILEQILPTFQPSYGVVIKPIDGQPQIKEDVNFLLTGVNIQDDYEGDFTERQIIIYNLTFDVKTLFHSGLADSNVIKTAIVNFYDYENQNNLIKGITQAVTPSDATEDETYTIVVTNQFGYDDA